jgi:thiol-disulfide isomerase/thioredoxin
MKKHLLLLICCYFSFQALAQSVNSLKGNKLSDDLLNSILYKTNEEKTTLREVLEELKGNAILVDFWASWCKTCAREMDYSKELEKYFESKKIVFLFLSTDTDYKQWLLGLGRINIAGKHYRIDEPSKKRIKEYFKIKGIPYYVLLDKEGYIFDPKASWPHVERLKNEIELLLSL